MMEGRVSRREYAKLKNNGTKLNCSDWCDVVIISMILGGIYIMVAASCFTSGWYLSANLNRPDCKVPKPVCKCDCNCSGALVPRDWMRACNLKTNFCQLVYSPCNNDSNYTNLQV